MMVTILTNTFSSYVVDETKHKDMLKRIGYPNDFKLLSVETLDYLFEGKITDRSCELCKVILNVRELGLDVRDLYDKLYRIMINLPNDIILDISNNYEFDIVKNMSMINMESLINKSYLYLDILTDAIIFCRGDIIKVVLTNVKLTMEDLDYLINRGSFFTSIVIMYTNARLIKTETLFELCVIKSYYNILLMINLNDMIDKTFCINKVTDPRIARYLLSSKTWPLRNRDVIVNAIRTNRIAVAKEIYSMTNTDVTFTDDDYKSVKFICKSFKIESYVDLYLAASNNVEELSKRNIDPNLLSSVFSVACENNSMDVVRLLSDKIDSKTMGPDYFTACKLGHIEVVKHILSIRPILSIYTQSHKLKPEIMKYINEVASNRREILKDKLLELNRQ